MCGWRGPHASLTHELLRTEPVVSAPHPKVDGLTTAWLTTEGPTDDDLIHPDREQSQDRVAVEAAPRGPA